MHKVLTPTLCAHIPNPCISIDSKRGAIAILCASTIKPAQQHQCTADSFNVALPTFSWLIGHTNHNCLNEPCWVKKAVRQRLTSSIPPPVPNSCQLRPPFGSHRQERLEARDRVSVKKQLYLLQGCRPVVGEHKAPRWLLVNKLYTYISCKKGRQ